MMHCRLQYVLTREKLHKIQNTRSYSVFQEELRSTTFSLAWSIHARPVANVSLDSTRALTTRIGSIGEEEKKKTSVDNESILQNRMNQRQQINYEHWNLWMLLKNNESERRPPFGVVVNSKTANFQPWIVHRIAERKNNHRKMWKIYGDLWLQKKKKEKRRERIEHSSIENYSKIISWWNISKRLCPRFYSQKLFNARENTRESLCLFFFRSSNLQTKEISTLKRTNVLLEICT